MRSSMIVRTMRSTRSGERSGSVRAAASHGSAIMTIAAIFELGVGPR